MPERESQRKIQDAFRQFEDSLRELLANEAQASVDGAIRRISMSSGPFRISDVEIDIVIRKLKVEAATTGEATPARRPARPSQRARRRPPTRSGGGRPPGPLRRALIETFAQTPGELTIDDVRGALDQRRVTSTEENLHQQLRRLVIAGELERTGRGRYRRRPGA